MFKGKILFFIIALCIIIIAIVSTGWIELAPESYLEGLRVEAGGFALDIILFGIIIGYYEIKRSLKSKIEDYKEQIEDYREWNEKEASYRIYGLIKRLIKLKQFDLDLSFCYFEDIQFVRKNFDSFNFHKSQLQGATFIKCNLKSCDFSSIKTEELPSNFYDYCNNPPEPLIFLNCNLKNSKFKGNTYKSLNIENSDITGLYLEDSNFIYFCLKKNKIDNINTDNNYFAKSCTFTSSKFEDIDFNEKIVDKCKFINCEFKQIDFSRLNIQNKVTFEGNCKFINCKGTEILNVK